MQDQGHLSLQEEVYAKNHIKIVQGHTKKVAIALLVTNLHRDNLSHTMDLLGFAINYLDLIGIIFQFQSQFGCLFGGHKIVSDTTVHHNFKLLSIHYCMHMH